MPAPKSIYFGLALSFCTLGITIAGLASVQNACEDTADGAAYVTGVSSFSSPMLLCTKIYRYDRLNCLTHHDADHCASRKPVQLKRSFRVHGRTACIGWTPGAGCCCII